MLFALDQEAVSTWSKKSRMSTSSAFSSVTFVSGQ